MNEQPGSSGHTQSDAMTITVDAECVHVAGEIDLGTAPALQDALRVAFEDRSPLVVDMSAVRFLDSSGIRALLSISGERDVRIVRPSDQVRAVIDMAGVAERFGLA